MRRPEGSGKERAGRRMEAAGGAGGAGEAGGAATPPVVDPQLQAATGELRTLGGCCKDSDNVLERINTMHDNLSKQGARVPGGVFACVQPRDPVPAGPKRPVLASAWHARGGRGRGSRRGQRASRLRGRARRGQRGWRSTARDRGAF